MQTPTRGCKCPFASRIQHLKLELELLTLVLTAFSCSHPRESKVRLSPREPRQGEHASFFFFFFYLTINASDPDPCWSRDSWTGGPLYREERALEVLLGPDLSELVHEVVAQGCEGLEDGQKTPVLVTLAVRRPVV
jgi:hypothetical protein